MTKQSETTEHCPIEAAVKRLDHYSNHRAIDAVMAIQMEFNLDRSQVRQALERWAAR